MIHGDIPGIGRMPIPGDETDMKRDKLPMTRLQQWNPERYGNGTIEDWKITVFSEPFEDFLKT